MATNKDNEANTAPTTPPIVIDQALITAIAAAVAAAMKGAGPQIDMAQMAEVIGTSVANGIGKTTRRRIQIGEYDPKTPWQPVKALAKHLTRQSFQNGIRFDDSKMNNTEIDLLNRITHSGRYLERQVEVIVNQDGADDTVDIRYMDKTAEQRIMQKGLWRSLEDMLKQIVDVQEFEDLEIAERDEKKTASRRAFGENKAFKEAAAAALLKEEAKNATAAR